MTATNKTPPAAPVEAMRAGLGDMPADDIRRRAKKIVTDAGWKPGAQLGLHSVLQLMQKLGEDIARNQLDQCGWPDCGCCADAACGEAALSASPAEKPLGREALAELEYLAATFGDMGRLGLADRDISDKEVGTLQFAEGAVRDAIARLSAPGSATGGEAGQESGGDPMPDRDGHDGTERLCRALYGRKAKARDYVGGSDARMLHDAADRLAALSARDAAAPSGWKPISTVPVPVGDWNSDIPLEASEGPSVAYRDDSENPEPLFLVYWSEDGPGASKVTHWAPLLPPPDAAQERGEKEVGRGA